MWKLTTLHKKSCTQIDYFGKDGMVASREIGWRWCEIYYDEKPDLSNYDPENDQIEVYDLGDVCDMSMNDGCWEEWTWPDELDQEEIDRLEELYNEEGEEALENEGWSLDDSECYVQGPLELEEVNR